MPIYEYKCDACGRHSEAIQRLSEEPLTECVECGGRIRRLISAPAVQFKGSGWYVTDYAGRGKSSDNSSDGSSATSEAKDGGATAAAPAKVEKSAGKADSKGSE